MQKIILAGIAVIITGCGGPGDSGRLSLDPRPLPPDEFLVVPSQPLQMPTDFAALPTPEPGAANLSDIDPTTGLARALGGRATGIPKSEAALVAAVGQPAPEIVEAKEGRLLDRILGRDDKPNETSQRLDPFAEAARLRALGIDVPPDPGR